MWAGTGPAGLPASLWDAIESALSELVGTDAKSDDEAFSDDDDVIMDIHGNGDS